MLAVELILQNKQRQVPAIVLRCEVNDRDVLLCLRVKTAFEIFDQHSDQFVIANAYSLVNCGNALEFMGYQFQLLRLC